ncbi:MAG: MFS transporter [Carboxylicivirga sp.]|nr:MFS transporter [Carboxylicivirga sp.]
MKSTLTQQQKTGISVLLLSKLFERLAFYLIITILTLFLSESLNMKATSTGVYYSIFYGAIFFLSLISGYLGDIGKRNKIVTTGMMITIVMYLSLAFLPHINVVTLIALIILALGLGLISPNIVVLLGNSYNEKDNEIIGLPGFILYSIVTSAGGLIAPFISVYLRSNLGFSAVFLLASVFGIISLILFNKFRHISSQTKLEPDKSESYNSQSVRKLNKVILFSVLFIGILIRFALNQKDLVFSFSVKDYLENGYQLNQTFQDLSTYAFLALLAVFAIIITRIKPLTWTKILNIVLIGVILCSFAFVTMAGFDSLVPIVGAKTIFIKSFFILLIAETILSPCIFYIIYRSSPSNRKGLFQGIWFLTIGISNQLLFIGAMLYEESQTIAYLAFSSCLIISVILILVLKDFVKKKLHEMTVGSNPQ